MSIMMPKITLTRADIKVSAASSLKFISPYKLPLANGQIISWHIEALGILFHASIRSHIYLVSSSLDSVLNNAWDYIYTPLYVSINQRSIFSFHYQITFIYLNDFSNFTEKYMKFLLFSMRFNKKCAYHHHILQFILLITKLSERFLLIYMKRKINFMIMNNIFIYLCHSRFLDARILIVLLVEFYFLAFHIANAQLPRSRPGYSYLFFWLLLIERQFSDCMRATKMWVVLHAHFRRHITHKVV